MRDKLRAVPVTREFLEVSSGLKAIAGSSNTVARLRLRAPSGSLSRDDEAEPVRLRRA
jgi:hypothetical protein